MAKQGAEQKSGHSDQSRETGKPVAVSRERGQTTNTSGEMPEGYYQGDDGTWRYEGDPREDAVKAANRVRRQRRGQ